MKSSVLAERWISENFTVPVLKVVQYQFCVLCKKKRLPLFRTKYLVIFRDES